MKKLIFALFLVITTLWSPICSAENMVPEITQVSESCSDLQIELKDLKYKRRILLTDFLEKHAGKDFVSKNPTLIYKLTDSNSPKASLLDVLKPYITSDKERTLIVNCFSWPSVNSYKLDSIQENLSSLLHKLRVPTQDGYKYASYSKEKYATVEKQKLTAKHEIGQFQNYTRTLEEPIFRIHIYSPTKNGLFSQNRDVYLETLTVKYNNGDKENTINKVFKKFLKRGESIDFELPEIARSATINLLFATKKSHKGKAIFFIEPLKACLKDDISSPYSTLVSKIQNFSTSSPGLDSLQNKLEQMQTALRQALIINSNQPSIAESSKTINKPMSSDKINDHLKYFHFLLLDRENDRDTLIEKFEMLFGK